jgi:oligopeptide/dipeptide ABC transporter ATP-binding protein
MSTLLSVRDLRVGFPGTSGPVYPVDGVSFELVRGETVALVGESGSGKSLTGLGLLNLVPNPGQVAAGSSVMLDGAEVLQLRGEALRRVRGGRIGMVFQDPLASLNPVLSVGEQVKETIEAHLPLRRSAAQTRAGELLAEVGLAGSQDDFDRYPHQLSGGMRQRVMLAIALAGEPDLLIADEPTSALDVTVQAQILALLDRLRRSRGLTVLLITHDLGIVAGRADRVLVMYAGRIVEAASTIELFANPAHPYTAGLLESLPRLRGPRRPLRPIPGQVPSPADWPVGCRFHPRCARRFGPCQEEPPVVELAAGHRMRCWLGQTSRVGSPA